LESGSAPAQPESGSPPAQPCLVWKLFMVASIAVGIHFAFVEELSMQIPACQIFG
ncbi:hypothetical protein S83_048069, partial [Arachis hypogaea]